jgi:hypothetical protein
MLKKEFDIFYANVCQWLFEKYTLFTVQRAYGATEIKDICKNDAFMEMELLSFVKSANERRNPNSKLLIPVGINTGDFNIIISNIKNKLL